MDDADGDADTRMRRWARRIVVAVFVVGQIGLVVRAYAAPHREFGYQMFPESSTWSAEIVRVTVDGRHVPIDEPWFGYEWSDLVRSRGLGRPSVEHHADSGLDSQIAFLGEALDWVAVNTPADEETLWLEATVTASRNGRAPTETTLRSVVRDTP